MNHDEKNIRYEFKYIMFDEWYSVLKQNNKSETKDR